MQTKVTGKSGEKSEDFLKKFLDRLQKKKYFFSAHPLPHFYTFELVYTLV